MGLPQVSSAKQVRFSVAFAAATMLLGGVSADPAQAEALRFSYWNEATAPWVNQDVSAPHKGILLDIGTLIAKNLGADAQFVKLPVIRIQSWLQEGKIDLDCVANPAWREKPELYQWTPTLFRDYDGLLVRKGQAATIKELKDLIGKKVAIYQNYTYRTDFTQMMTSGQIEAINMADLETGMKLLRLGRVDAVVDFGIVLQYHLRDSKIASEFELAQGHLEDFDLQCAYTKAMPIKPERMNDSIRKLVENGAIESVLVKYR